METVQSADGTTIAFDRSGRGSAVILVVGAFCDRSSSKSLAVDLESRFTVYEYDRRGRGDSGDTAPYGIEREAEDLAAVVIAAAGSAFVYGHSSGTALALEAAARDVAMRKLAVYEPPYKKNNHPNSCPRGWLESWLGSRSGQSDCGVSSTVCSGDSVTTSLTRS